jgi:membrane fusion protein (multidrug efflux system)
VVRLATLIALLPALACAQAPLPPAAKPPATVAPIAPAAAATPVAEGNAIRVLLAPELETTLVAQTAARIDRLDATLGQPVAKGKLLVGFECGEAQARLRMADAELAAARDALTGKTGLKKLNAAGDLEVSTAQANVDRAAGAVSLARAQAGHCSVAAPFNGRIARMLRPAAPGGRRRRAAASTWSATARSSCASTCPRPTCASSRPARRFDVAVNETGKTYPAKVTAINARVDAVAQTVELEARIDGSPAELLAGMSGIARFPFAP